MDLDEATLPLERFQIMRHRHEVGFGRQPIGRMAPIGIPERAELAALDKAIDAIAHPGKIARTGQRPVRNRLGKG